MRTLAALCLVGGLLAPLSSNALVIVNSATDAARVNSLGSALDNTNGGNTPTGYFPSSDDSTFNTSTAPDLSTVSGLLGNWLGSPPSFNSNWSAPVQVAPNWPLFSELAVVYQFDTLGATNVVAKFGVDNGIYIWLDGVFQTGHRAGGGPSLGEVTLNIGDLTAGTHFLQLILEDHGAANGYVVEITADTFTPCSGPCPGPTPPSGVPIPSTLALLGIGLGALAFSRRTKLEFAKTGR